MSDCITYPPFTVERVRGRRLCDDGRHGRACNTGTAGHQAQRRSPLALPKRFCRSSAGSNVWTGTLVVAGTDRWFLEGFVRASFCYCYSFYWYVACIYFVIGACMVDYIHLICVFKWEKFFSFFLSLFVLLFIVLFTRCHLLHFLLLHFHVCLPLFFVSVVLLFSHFTLLVLCHILLSPVSSSLYHHVFRLFSLSFPHILSIIVLSSDFFLPFPFFLVATSSLPASFSFLERPCLYSLSPR